MSDEAPLSPDALLERIARTLKQDIGPAVSADYPKTQAFMASVVLQKLAGQLRSADTHARENRRDTEALVADLEHMLGEAKAPSPAVAGAVERLAKSLDDGALTATVEALYACRSELGDELFRDLRGRVRELLRARIDRALSYAA